MNEEQIAVFNNILFIYTRDEEVKVLTYNNSLIGDLKLQEEGYKHVGTIDTVKWVQANWNLVENNTLIIK